MTIEDLQLSLEPVIIALDRSNALLSGIIAFLGVIAGLVIAEILFDRW